LYVKRVFWSEKKILINSKLVEVFQNLIRTFVTLFCISIKNFKRNKQKKMFTYFRVSLNILKNWVENSWTFFSVCLLSPNFLCWCCGIVPGTCVSSFEKSWL
jgi:hypothetical protein